MNALLSGGGDGTTPLSPDESAGLLLDYVTTRGELLDAEQNGFFDADRWVQRRAARLGLDVVLDPVWLRGLHRRALGEVWAWAGTDRTTDKSVGIEVAPHQVGQAVADLVADARYWFDDARGDGAAVDLAAVRLHHRLVLIHPFPDGNGRTTRLYADAVLLAADAAPFTWGAASGVEVGQVRQDYLAALRQADRDHRDHTWDGPGLQALLACARS